MKHAWIVVVGLAFVGASPVAVTQSTDHLAHHASPEAANTQSMTEGEVRKVDKEAGKLTLRHGPIPNLEMPNMTMVFVVKDPVFLELVKVGDKVKFTAEKVNGVYTVTAIDVVK